MSVDKTPLRVDDPDQVEWDDVTDVLVIGFGGAGAVAALQARDNGADVIAADRFRGGGATAYSGGVVYAGGTSFQREAGFNDSPDAMFNYLSMEYQNCVGEDTLRRFCEGSAGDIDWLSGKGVEFNSAVITGKTGYPPDDKFLYFSGNEKIASYKAKATPAPRGHRTVGTAFTGYAYFAALREAAEQAGTRIMPHLGAQRLIVDADGRVIGAEFLEIPAEHRAEHDALYDRVNPHKPFIGPAAEIAIPEARAFEEKYGVTRRIRARHGVILATGGFVYNLDMLRKHRPELAERQAVLLRLGGMGCDGSGIEMGEAAGGATRFLDSAFVARLISPPFSLVKGVVVNKYGDRFINEEIYCGFLGDAIARQPDATGWLILDSKGFWKIFRECLSRDKAQFKVFLLPTLMNIFLGGTRRARTLAGLARKLGLDPARLEATVTANNAAAADTEPDAFAKSPDNRGAIVKAPYYALNVSTANKFSFTQLFTLGGLQLDETTGNVIRADGSRIEGLFAAGRSAVGLCSIGYVSGMSLADTVFSGRRAGRSASDGGAIDAPLISAQRQQ